MDEAIEYAPETAISEPIKSSSDDTDAISSPPSIRLDPTFGAARSRITTRRRIGPLELAGSRIKLLIVLGLAALIAIVWIGLKLVDSGDGSIMYDVVATDYVNLRERPSLDSDTLALVPAGAVIEFAECNNGWCRIELDGTSGYISSTYITPRSSVWPTSIQPFREAVAEENVNQRVSPRTGTPIQTIPQGSPLRVANCEGGWCFVEFHSRQGWVALEYLGFR